MALAHVSCHLYELDHAVVAHEDVVSWELVLGPGRMLEGG